MEFREIVEKLGVDSYPEEFDEIYAQVRDTDIPACDIALIDRLQTEYDIFGEFYDAVKQAAQTINEDPFRSAWVKTAATYAMDRTMKQAEDITMPKTDGTLAGDFLPLYILLPMIPVSIDDYKSRGFAGEDLENILKEYKISIRIVQRQTGRPGIDQTYYGWLMIFAKAEIFCTMGLQFQIYNLSKMALWLRNRQTGLVVPLMLRGEFHCSGVQQLGSKGYEDAEGSICPDFSEDEQNFYGYGVFDNVMSTQRQTFSKNVWECVGRPGDVCFNIHVPRGSDISRATVLAACADAKNIAARRYPELPEMRLVLGISWLLNPKLREIQGEQARTTQFMECFTKYPNRDVDGSSMIKFVFGKAYEDYNDLPEDTSLQRKMKALYLSGGCLHKYTGTIYIGEK